MGAKQALTLTLWFNDCITTNKCVTNKCVTINVTNVVNSIAHILCLFYDLALTCYFIFHLNQLVIFLFPSLPWAKFFVSHKLKKLWSTADEDHLSFLSL